MFLNFAGFRNGVPVGRGLLPLKGKEEIKAADLVGEYQRLCCDSKRMSDHCECCKQLLKWGNLPRGFVFIHHGNDIWSYSIGSTRSSVKVASVYFDGGRLHNKIKPDQKFTLKEGSQLYLRPPVEKRDDKGMHDIEFRVVEVIEVKLEDEEVEKEDEDEDEGNINATNANANATTPSDVVPTPYAFTQEDRLRLFGPTAIEYFDNTIRKIGFSPIRSQNSSPLQDDEDLLAFSPSVPYQWEREEQQQEPWVATEDGTIHVNTPPPPPSTITSSSSSSPASASASPPSSAQQEQEKGDDEDDGFDLINSGPPLCLCFD